MFDRSNITEFLESYEGLCQDYHVQETDMSTRLPRYCTSFVAETVKSLKEWQDRDYKKLRKALLQEYKSADAYQKIYSVSYLERFKNIVRTDTDDMLEYCRTFRRVAQYCIEKGILSQYTAGVWFLYRLLPVYIQDIV